MIGIFDSGAGGVFVLQKLVKSFPSSDFLYLADKAHFPYGEKSSSFIRKITKQNIDFLADKGAKHVIIACNTASTTVIEKPFRKTNVKVTEIITASLKTAHLKSLNQKVGVLATSKTVQSKAFIKQAKILDLNLKIYQKSCPLFAPFIEEKQKNFRSKKDYLYFKLFITKKEKLYLNKLFKFYIDPLLKKKVSAIILGCTHYLYLKPFIMTYIKTNSGFTESVKLISPLSYLSRELKKNILQKENQKQKIRMFITPKNGR